MTNFRNLKIAINDQQPLDEVMRELKRLGYRLGFRTKSNIHCVQTYSGVMVYELHQLSSFKWLRGELTTLAELKEMK